MRAGDNVSAPAMGLFRRFYLFEATKKSGIKEACLTGGRTFEGEL
jgi:hypothetical protein